MAKSTQQKKEFGELIRRSEAARLQIGLAHSRFKRRLDLPSRIKDSIKSEPGKWLGISAVVGFVGSVLLKSKKTPPIEKAGPFRKKRRFSLAMVALLVRLAKPAAKIYATKLIKDYLTSRLQRGIARRPAVESRLY